MFQAMSNWKKDRLLYSSLVLWENQPDHRWKKNYYHLHFGQSKLSIIGRDEAGLTV